MKISNIINFVGLGIVSALVAYSATVCLKNPSTSNIAISVGFLLVGAFLIYKIYFKKNVANSETISDEKLTPVD